MAELAGGAIAEGLVDEYPLPPTANPITISSADCLRWLGVELELEEMAAVLRIAVTDPVGRELASRHGVRAVPTFVLFDGDAPASSEPSVSVSPVPLPGGAGGHLVVSF